MKLIGITERRGTATGGRCGGRCRSAPVTVGRDPGCDCSSLYLSARCRYLLLVLSAVLTQCYALPLRD